MGSGEILSLPRTWEGLREGVDLVRIEVYEDRMERLPQGSLQSLLLSPPQARGCLSPFCQNLNPNCDGKCVICDSYVRPCTLVRICDECNYGSYQGRCVICGGPGVSDAYYCKECTIQEKDVSIY
ncbi:PHD finger-like domain-containing protein 5A, partial [Eschrichtius robustus]|nr:PHD finger-like domain-containing protein 5A [Eschrichtius robustus]